MTEYLSYASAQDYVKEVNGQLYDLLLHKQPIPAKAWLQSSPEPSSLRCLGPSTGTRCLGLCPNGLANSATPQRDDCDTRRLIRPVLAQPQPVLAQPQRVRYLPLKLWSKMPMQTLVKEETMSRLFMTKTSALMKRQPRSWDVKIVCSIPSTFTH